MNLDRTQLVAGVGLLALIPAVLYVALEEPWPAILTLLNVLLISAGLYYMMSPTEHEDDHAAGH
ncbi:hypothetical protein [Haloarchaeobius amylolyticus]|uniref:hypothetical protein n=1 Tax=Haloarchaeobius amylolyticus TaxID=1198296 RepID=UPI00227023C5|nr:hypothetical protein [Haloarchaeobius amylolyticus]